jgi:hypothetical protein
VFAIDDFLRIPKPLGMEKPIVMATALEAANNNDGFIRS